MIDQHLYMIVPSELADSIHVDMPMILDGSYLMSFGWQHSRVSVASIGTTNGKTALHLYFREDKYHQDWTELLQEIMFNTESADPLAESWIEATEQALCLAPGVMICLDIEHLKARDPDFAVVNTVSDEEGGAVEVLVLQDTVFAV